MNLKLLKQLAIIILLVLFAGCSSYNVKPGITAEERFALAKTMFKNRDYQDAMMQFKILTLNNPGARFTDEAQYYLAECHFNQKEYILASDEYNRLMRLYPRSQWVDDCQFKVGMCDFKLSPKPTLDQKYTLQAVASFQTFLEDFPNSDLVPEAERLLKICRTKLAEKDYKSAELYRKLKEYYAALVYFDSVLESYYDTKFAHPALYWKSECLYELDRKDEAADSFEELISKYPKSKFRAKSISRLKELQSDLANSSHTDGKTSIGSQPKNQLR